MFKHQKIPYLSIMLHIIKLLYLFDVIMTYYANRKRELITFKYKSLTMKHKHGKDNLYYH